MVSSSELLIAHGFVKSSAAGKYDGKTFDERTKFIAEQKAKKGAEEIDKEILDDADHEEAEIVKNQIIILDYPKPAKRYYLVYETFQQSIEPLYYWALNHLTNDLGFPWVEKVTDVFTASEHSSFYGSSAQRLGLTQDKVQSYLALIGQFIRNDLFQLIRDLRWLDERIDYHEKSRKGDKAAEMALKGIWIDMIDGKVQGQPVAANIFQMAQQLQFQTLPDFFFSAEPKSIDDVDAAVERITTTTMVKNVLKRKLHTYMVWREANYKELEQRKQFELKYLRQHYNIIKMYLAWLKPYMKYAERLRADLSKIGSADIISAFEGSMIDIEILASQLPEKNKEVYACILLTFEYRTRPSMEYSDPTRYQRGPIHVGETRITWRAYNWTKEQIENYISLREKNDFDSLANIDSTIKAVIDAIGQDLWTYLEQAEEKVTPSEKLVAEVAGATGASRTEVEKFIAKKKLEEKQKKAGGPTLFDSFADIAKSFKDIVKEFKRGEKTKIPAEVALKKEAETKNAKGTAEALLYVHYKNFKKAHGMLSF